MTTFYKAPKACYSRVPEAIKTLLKMGRSRSRVATDRAVLSYFGWAVCVLGLSWSSREIAVTNTN